MPATTPVIGTLDISGLSESDRLAFYGALFSMSAADNKMVESETDRIFQSLDLAQMSGNGRKEVFTHSVNPPPLERCLLVFKDADLGFRRALMLNLIDIVLADKSIEPGEHLGLHQARQILDLSLDETAVLHNMAYTVQNYPESETVRRPIRLIEGSAN